MKTVEERFWEKVNKKGDDQCWEWKGHLDKWGYGRFRLNKVFMHAHRASYIINVGEIEDGILACHTCDNPPCVNPYHIFKGSPSENTKDMYNKGRRFQDRSNNGNSKLTEEDVDCIRSVYSNGDATQKKLAEEFGVCKETIYLIIHYKLWK